tara:strand:+ start:326 stop:634 length:309 start_codon:yes stop_codon:yes gene_type:complete
MAYIEINGVRYPKVKIVWRDIIGAGSFGDLQEFKELLCPVMVTEGYLFDTFEEDGEKYIRTFASYQISDEPAFGDRNCFPFSVLTSKSQRDIEMALLFCGET